MSTNQTDRPPVKTPAPAKAPYTPDQNPPRKDGR